MIAICKTCQLYWSWIMIEPAKLQYFPQNCRVIWLLSNLFIAEKGILKTSFSENSITYELQTLKYGLEYLEGDLACNLWYNVLKNWKTGKAPFFTVIMGRSVKFFCLLNITHLPLWIIDTYHFPQKQDLVIFPRSKCYNVVQGKMLTKACSWKPWTDC